jgi:glycosyltransferase involved in cell wall biosynthesis
LGETRDVRPFLAACSVFVLPTYYREGIPRSILEALATGRPIITTDAYGCRDTVIQGKNGFLVPAQDVAKLVAAMESFILNPELISSMGRSSNDLARNKFDVHAVNQLLLKSMNLI